MGTNETAVYEEVDCVRDANGNCKINKTILNIEFSEEITTNSKRIDCTELRNKKNNNQSLTPLSENPEGGVFIDPCDRIFS